MQVLIVDPSEEVQRQIVACLPSSWQPDVIYASGLLDASWAALTQRPELIVLDLLLPDCAGIDLLRLLRRMSPNSIIAVHSIHQVFEQRCRLEGADYFFSHFDAIRNLHDVATAGKEVRWGAEQPA